MYVCNGFQSYWLLKTVIEFISISIFCSQMSSYAVETSFKYGWRVRQVLTYGFSFYYDVAWIDGEKLPSSCKIRYLCSRLTRRSHFSDLEAANVLFIEALSWLINIYLMTFIILFSSVGLLLINASSSSYLLNWSITLYVMYLSTIICFIASWSLEPVLDYQIYVFHITLTIIRHMKFCSILFTYLSLNQQIKIYLFDVAWNQS